MMAHGPNGGTWLGRRLRKGRDEVKAEEFLSEVRELNGTKVEVHVYKIGDSYYCHVSNTDPGATIARGEGKTRDEAIANAVEKAQSRLK
jgi:hypothetical protein